LEAGDVRGLRLCSCAPSRSRAARREAVRRGASAGRPAPRAGCPAVLRRAAAHHLPPRGPSKSSPLGPIPSHSRQRGPGGGAVGGGEKRSGRVGARSAHPKLTRRRCLSGALVEREASSTAQPGREHRSGVGLTADRTRRPRPQAPAAARRTQTRQTRQTRRASKVLKTDQAT
jgi:hypothetical protein